MPADKRGVVEIRQDKQKEVLVEELRKRPIVQSACQKVGIGRASYYRWRKEDPGFAAAVDEAVESGVGLVNDVAETQLMTAIREGNMTAVVFWLKHHHRSYATRVELSMPEKRPELDLTPEQAELIRKSVAMLSTEPDSPAPASAADATQAPTPKPVTK